MRNFLFGCSIKLIFIFGVDLFLLSGGAQAQSALTHCSSAENNYFSCRIKNSENIISICGKGISGDSEKDLDEYLEYRYGQAGKIVFKFPPRPARMSEAKFLGEYDRPYGEDFEADSVFFTGRHVTHHITIVEGRGVPPFTGLWVTRGKKVSKYQCASGAISESLLALVLKLPPAPKH